MLQRFLREIYTSMWMPMLACALLVALAPGGLGESGESSDASESGDASEEGVEVAGSGPPPEGPPDLEGTFRVRFGEAEGEGVDVGWIDLGPADGEIIPVVGGSLGGGYFEPLEEPGEFVGILDALGAHANPLVARFDAASYVYEFEMGNPFGSLLPEQDPADQDPKPGKGRRKVKNPEKPNAPIIIIWCTPKPGCTYDWMQFVTFTAKVRHTPPGGVPTEKLAPDSAAIPCSGNGGGTADNGKPHATDKQKEAGAGTAYIDGKITYVDSLKPGETGYRAAGGTGGKDKSGNETMVDTPELPPGLAKAVGAAIDPVAGPYPAGTKHELIFTMSFWAYFTCDGNVTDSCHWTVTWTYDLINDKFVGEPNVNLGPVNPATNQSLTPGEKFARDNYKAGKFDGGKSTH